MKVYQVFKYELKPNNKQVGLLIKHCGVARFTWNWGLARRIELYKAKEGIEKLTNDTKQHRELNALKKTIYPWMYEVSKYAPQSALQDLDQAYDNFYRSLKKHEWRSKPKFKKKGAHDSFRVVNDNIHRKTNSIETKLNFIKLPRLGFVHTKESTNKLVGRILHATIIRETDRWFCSLCVEVERTNPAIVHGDIIGIDLGITSFAVISNGKETKSLYSPKPLRKRIKMVKRLHRQQDHKKRGSKNWRKAKLRLSRLYRRIKNIRKDFLAKESTKLAKTKSVICIEDLNVSGMTRNHHLARSIGDEGWGTFKQMLEYKTKWYGSQLIKIGRFEPSSKTCSICGEINKNLILSDRTWVCMKCGVVHDRDANAAKNIRQLGIKQLNTESSSGINACGVDVSPSVMANDRETGSKRTSQTYGTDNITLPKF
jgi:putative transposase